MHPTVEKYLEKVKNFWGKFTLNLIISSFIPICLLKMQTAL